MERSDDVLVEAFGAETAERVRRIELELFGRFAALGHVEPVGVVPELPPAPGAAEPPPAASDPALLAALDLMRDVDPGASDGERETRARWLLCSLAAQAQARTATRQIPEDRELTMRELSDLKRHVLWDYVSDRPGANSLLVRKY